MKVLKKIFYWITGVVLLLILSAVLTVFFYGKEVKHYIVNELNKAIRIKVDVKDIDFTVLRYFPNAAVTFKEVYARNTLDDDTLCMARHISLLFNLKDIFNKNYTVRRIYVYDGVLKLKVDEAGNNSYTFWDKNNGPETKFAVQLSLLKVEKLRLRYENKTLHRFFNITMNEAELSGRFSEKEYAVKISGEGVFNNYTVAKAQLIADKTFRLKAMLFAAGNNYNITSGELTLAGISLKASGAFELDKGKNRVDIALSAKNQKLESIDGLLPSAYIHDKGFSDYKGTVNILLKAKGVLSDTQIPLIRADFSIANGEMTLNNKTKVTLREITLDGSYTNKILQGNELLELKNIALKIDDTALKGELSISNFENPYLKAKINGSAPVSALLLLSGIENVSNVAGKVDFNMALEDKVSLIGHYNIKNNLKAMLVLHNVNIHFDKTNADLVRVNGTFTNVSGELDFKEVSGTLNGSDFLTSGTIADFIPWIFNDSVPLRMQADLFSHTLDMDKLLAVKSNNVKDTSRSRKLNYSTIQLKLNLANVHFKKTDAQGFNANLTITPRALQFNDVVFNTMNGSVYLDGKLTRAGNDSSSLKGIARVKELNITELFKRLDNFGQSALLSTNIRGNVTANVAYTAKLDSKGVLNMNSLDMEGDVDIENGELLNFKPVMALSRYIKLKELQDVKFSSLKNHIVIKGSVIMVPEMEINSNALNITASATHTFSNQIDYKLQLRLSELLGKKVRDQSTEFGDIEDDGSGKTIVPVRMYGDINNPKFTIDKSLVKQRVKKRLKTEWQTLKDVLKKEFKTDQKAVSGPVDAKTPLEPEIDLDKPAKKTSTAESEAAKRKTRLQKLKDKLKGDDE